MDDVHRFNKEYLELQQYLDYEKKKKKRFQEAIEKQMGKHMMRLLNVNVIELGLVDLQEYQKWLEIVDDLVKEMVNKILVQARKIT